MRGKARSDETGQNRDERRAGDRRPTTPASPRANRRTIRAPSPAGAVHGSFRVPRSIAHVVHVAARRRAGKKRPAVAGLGGSPAGRVAGSGVIAAACAALHPASHSRERHACAKAARDEAARAQDEPGHGATGCRHAAWPRAFRPAFHGRVATRIRRRRDEIPIAWGQSAHASDGRATARAPGGGTLLVSTLAVGDACGPFATSAPEAP